MMLVEHRNAPPWGAEGPLVSILCPVRDEQKHLPGMLDSVLASTWTRFEVVLVNDGSSDHTAEILADYSGRDERVRVVGSGAAIGKVAAFNAAYAASTGQIICHVGGDDTIPTDALAHRVRALAPLVGQRAVAFFKLELFDQLPGDRPVVVPRGRRGSMSGPSITMTRLLADQVMPIPSHLVSEDIWMGNAADALADVRVDSEAVVVHYRRHAGNSNPRSKSFAGMSDAIHARMQALGALLETDRFDLPPEHRARLEAKVAAEELRRDGRTVALLRSDLPPVDRVAIASMANPLLWRVRSTLLTPLTGWRGR